MPNGAHIDFVQMVSRRLCLVRSFRSALYAALFVAAFQVLTLPSATAQDPSQSAANQNATIRGVVLSTLDNKPIPGAHVSLNQNDRSVYTDDKGQFAFSGVPAGSMSVSVEKPGFLCFLRRSPQKPKCREYVEVPSGNIPVTLTMVPQASVTGRIVDQTGKPIAKLDLCLMVRGIQNGMYTWTNASETHQQTDADGAFRIADLESGTYLLHTSIKPDPEHSGYGYAATYYPGTFIQNEATRIVIHAGDELKLGLTVTDQQFQPVSVNYGHRDWKTGSGEFGLLHETASSDWNYYHHEYDTFEEDLTSRQPLYRLFLPAGEYTVRFRIYPPNDPVSGNLLRWPDGSKEPYLGSMTFTVKDQPVTLTHVPSQHPINIRLHVRSELAPQAKRKAQRECGDPLGTSAQFNLREQLTHGAAENYWQPDCGPSNFEFKNNYPGQYAFEVTDPQGAYVASLTCGSTNLLREPLVVRPGVPLCLVEAVIRDDLSSLYVGFTPQAAARLTAAGITEAGLALIPVENSLQMPYLAGLELASEPEKLPVPPGTYLVVPFDGLPIAWRDPDEQKRLMSLGTMVTLAPRQSKTISFDWGPELIEEKTAPERVFSRRLP